MPAKSEIAKKLDGPRRKKGSSKTSTLKFTEPHEPLHCGRLEEIAQLMAAGSSGIEAYSTVKGVDRSKCTKKEVNVVYQLNAQIQKKAIFKARVAFLVAEKRKHAIMDIERRKQILTEIAENSAKSTGSERCKAVEVLNKMEHVYLEPTTNVNVNVDVSSLLSRVRGIQP